MNLFLRLFAVAFTALFARRLGPFDESVLIFRVWPNDVDIIGHMNNGRYLTLMDLGTINVIIRTGLGRLMFRHRWWPAVGSATIRFKHSLKPFERYQLRTRVLCWDDKWFFMEHRFENADGIVAIGMAKCLFRSRSGNIAPSKIVQELGFDSITPPSIPESVTLWLQAETLMGVQ